MLVPTSLAQPVVPPTSATRRIGMYRANHQRRAQLGEEPAKAESPN
jgi:hypothetical protein